MSITPRQMLVGSSKYSIKCPYTMTAEAITVHNTANDASADNEISYMRNNNDEKSFHFAIDDKEVVQGIPINRNAWHAGDGGQGYGNRKTIGIEICYSKSGGPKFDAAEKLAAKFIAQLLKERGWDTGRVGTHQQRSGKYCPHRTLDYGWQRFLNMVNAELLELGRIKVDWRDVTPQSGTIDGTTDLINVATGKVVKQLSGGFGWVQETADGKYIRTAWSRDNNSNNGILKSAIKAPELETKPEPKPVEVSVKWEDVEETKAIVQGNTNLIDVVTKAIISRVSGDYIYTQIAEVNGERYARTAEAATQGLDYGVPVERLTTLQDSTEPAEETNGKDDPEFATSQAEVELAPLPSTTKNFWGIIIEAIVGFFKALFGKKDS